MLQVYSTLTRKKEPFHKRPEDGPVSMYVCGPTVYKPSHIGHMVGPVIFDTVKRYLTYLGYDVKWVVNITDVDDKLIKRAAELNTTVPALAEKMTADYFDCLKKLNVTGIDQFPKATDHIPGMIGMISTLIEKGYAYPAGGDVYFDVSKDKDYGKLCNRDPGQLEAGARIEVSDKKRNPGDFALWKGAKPGEPAEVQFDSPWGKGRPGWHIECSAMSRALLGDTLDIHGGGLDLQFPHHENELAQSESTTDAPFARVWMHNGLLRLGKEKMAGSVGNVVNVADAVQHMSGDAIRFFVLSTHYRSPIEMGDWPVNEDTKKHKRPLPDNMLAAKTAFEGFPRFAERVKRITGTAFADLKSPHPSAVAAADLPRKGGGEEGGWPAERPIRGGDVSFKHPAHTEFYRRFRDYMDDDFNTGGAVGVLFELVTMTNRLADMHKLEDPTAKDETEMAKALFVEAATLAKGIADILGLTFATNEATLGGGDQLVSGLMQLLLDLRANLRTEAKSAAKDNPLKKALFDQTDLIRKRLADLGVTLEDRPGGTTWRVG